MGVGMGMDMSISMSIGVGMGNGCHMVVTYPKVSDPNHIHGTVSFSSKQNPNVTWW